MSPSQPTKTSATPRFFSSASTHPALRGLPATVASPQTEHILVAAQVDPDRGVDRPVAELPTTDPHVDSRHSSEKRQQLSPLVGFRVRATETNASVTMPEAETSTAPGPRDNATTPRSDGSAD